MVEEHALYRFFDAKDRLLYIGITGDLERRFSGHRGDKPWWRYVVTIRIERFPTRGELAIAEVRAIETEHPKYNKAHAAGQLQTTKVPARTLPSPGSQANVFGTVQPDLPILDPSTVRTRLMYPCSDCGWPAVKFGDRAECLNLTCNWWMPIDDYVRHNEPWRR